MKVFKLNLKPEQIAKEAKAELVLRNKVKLNNVAELDEANAQSVCFFENQKYLEKLKDSQAGLYFVPKDFDQTLLPEANLLLVEQPYMYFMMLVQKWLKLDAGKLKAGIAKSAVIHKSAKVSKSARIDDNVVIGANVVVGKNTHIEANCVVREESVIGDYCHLYPNVTIYHETRIGNNVILHSGVVLGADGFGFIYHEGIQNKVPQVGNVVIKDDVEIGANSCIDRGALGSTVIGKGTKVDNLVQVGHNCKLGEHTILCAQVGLAGSTEVGNVVYLAGQVGAAGHIKIDDFAMVGAQSGVSRSIEKGAKVLGTPAMDAGLRKRIMASERMIPNVVKDYKKRMKNKG